MARTPLLRSLISFAREHAAADARGIPVQAIREQREQRAENRKRAGLSRRGFLGAGAAAAATMLLPKVARAGSQPTVAIVGAGIAGLSAALRLQDHGIAATVYEASARIGGRMFTNTSYFSDGQHFEWCGELIDSGHLTIKKLSARFGLILDDLFDSEPHGASDTFYFFGRYHSKAEIDTAFKAIQFDLKEDLRKSGYPTNVFLSTPYGRMLDNMSVYDWIEWRVPGGHASPLGALLDVAYYIELNNDTRDQSALNILYLLAYQPNWTELAMFGVSDEKYKIRGGNQQLPTAIANSLPPEQLKLGMRMEAIKRTPGGRYDLTFRRAQTTSVVTADIVLLTTPFAVLRNLDYSRAGFDERKHFAIQNLGRGRQSKQHLQFKDRIWYDKGPKPAPGTGGSYSDTGYQATWEASRAQPGASGIFVGYCGGPFADAMSSKTAFATATSAAVRQDATRFLAQAEPVFPGLTALWNGKAAQGLPHLDPNLQLSYSFFKVGQYQTIGAYERVTQGGVYFAGEHCSMDFQGFMEGGAIEGERAGDDILKAIGLKR